MKPVAYLPILIFIIACSTLQETQFSQSYLNKKARSRESYIENIEARKIFNSIRNNPSIKNNTKLYYEAIRELSQRYPHERIIKIYEAALMGDFGQSLSPKKEKEYKNKAVEIIRPFLNYEFDDPAGLDRVITFNEFYYHSGDYLKQYQFGKEINKLGGYGDFSIGVGASMHALSLAQKGKCQEAISFASEAEQAWKRFSRGNEKKVKDNPFYVGSLAISGKCNKSETLFENHIKKTPNWKNLTRWYNKFHPQNISCCHQ